MEALLLYNSTLKTCLFHLSMTQLFMTPLWARHPMSVCMTVLEENRHIGDIPCPKPKSLENSSC
jgi:hypothetical protein